MICSYLQLPPGKLTKLLNMDIDSWFPHQKWRFSKANYVADYQRVFSHEHHEHRKNKTHKTYVVEKWSLIWQLFICCQLHMFINLKSSPHLLMNIFFANISLLLRARTGSVGPFPKPSAVAKSVLIDFRAVALAPFTPGSLGGSLGPIGAPQRGQGIRTGDLVGWGFLRLYMILLI